MRKTLSLAAAGALLAAHAFGQTLPSPKMAGVNAGQTVLPYTAAQHNFQTYDGTIQFSIGLQAGAAEYWQAQGGTTGVGANLFATNGTPLSGNVDGNFVAQGNGNLWFGSGSGWGLKIVDPGAVSRSYLTMTAGTSTTNAKLSSSGGTITQVDASNVVSFSVNNIEQAQVINLNSMVAPANVVALFGNATGGGTGIRCKGDTNTACWIRPTGSASVLILNDVGTIFTAASSSAGTSTAGAVTRAASSTAPVLYQASSGNLGLGGVGGAASQMATNATAGFVGIPTTNGVPTGTPTTANVAYAYLEWNDVSHTLNIYDTRAGAWYHITATAGAN